LCPAFVSDCLETLEEIAMRGKEIFMLAGGESFTMIPCLNTHPLWVDAVEGYFKSE
jgi:ferrochelatase